MWPFVAGRACGGACWVGAADWTGIDAGLVEVGVDGIPRPLGAPSREGRVVLARLPAIPEIDADELTRPPEGDALPVSLKAGDMGRARRDANAGDSGRCDPIDNLEAGPRGVETAGLGDCGGWAVVTRFNLSSSCPLSLRDSVPT